MNKSAKDQKIKTENIMANEEILPAETVEAPVPVTQIFKTVPGFNYEDDTLPPNWGSKAVYFGNKLNQKLICTPEGKQFTSRPQAYEHMLSTNKYSQQEVDKVMETL